ncbi:MAG: hypothetical protein PHI31_16020 [Desulfuromonadaceae bacterium]|nr:hypothetical protein [Desulfuromonadaceae bacterium]
MKIAIIIAMPEEFRAVAANFGTITEMPLGIFRAGRYRTGDLEYLLVQSGMGLRNAATATEALIKEFRPELLIATGFCGAVTPGLLAGDILVAEHVIIADESGCEEIPVHLSGIGQTFTARQKAEGKRVMAGTFISTASITSKAYLTKLLSAVPPNTVVDMESGAIAIIAAEHAIPMLVLRAVSDTADEELGFSLNEFCDEDLRCIRPYKVLLTILRKPHIMPQLVRLAFSSRKAAQSITTTLSRLFADL